MVYTNMILFTSAQSSGNSSMRKSLCVITDIHTTLSFLVLFIASFAFDTFVSFTAALLTVLRHTFYNKPNYVINALTLNIPIIHYMLKAIWFWTNQTGSNSIPSVQSNKNDFEQNPICIGLDCICLTTAHVLKDILAVFHK